MLQKCYGTGRSGLGWNGLPSATNIRSQRSQFATFGNFSLGGRIEFGIFFNSIGNRRKKGKRSSNQRPKPQTSQLANWQAMASRIPLKQMVVRKEMVTCLGNKLAIAGHGIASDADMKF